MIYNDVQKLIDYALKNRLITDYDIYVVRNELMQALNLTEWPAGHSSAGCFLLGGRRKG